MIAADLFRSPLTWLVTDRVSERDKPAQERHPAIRAGDTRVAPAGERKLRAGVQFDSRRRLRHRVICRFGIMGTVHLDPGGAWQQ